MNLNKEQTWNDEIAWNKWIGEARLAVIYVGDDTHISNETRFSLKTKAAIQKKPTYSFERFGQLFMKSHNRMRSLNMNITHAATPFCWKVGKRRQWNVKMYNKSTFQQVYFFRI